VASLELALSGAAVTALGGFRKSFIRKRQSRAVAVALQPIALGWVSGPHWWARSPGPLKASQGSHQPLAWPAEHIKNKSGRYMGSSQLHKALTGPATL
jgi:hypothetical protein